MAALLREAAISAIKRHIVDQAPKIITEDFEYSLNKTFPSVSMTDRSLYQNMQKTLKCSRGRLESGN